MPPLFVVEDAVFGVPVRLEPGTWYRHILPRHPDMAPHLPDVRDAITEPDAVIRSRHDRSTQLYHRLLAPGGPYVRVAVRFRYNEQGAPVEGVVATAHLTTRLPGGDVTWLAPRLPFS